MQAFDDEPQYAAERFVSLERLRREIAARAGTISGRPLCVGLDGRSASGKSTASRVLAEGQSDWVVIHTDDVAWWHSFFDWDDLLLGGVLEPARRGDAVAYRPPPWDERGREGTIEVPAGTSVLIIEGVGSSRWSLAEHLDLTIWVQTPPDEMERRERARLAAGTVDEKLQRDWTSSEVAFLAADRPWSRAEFIVSGASGTT
jgi:pantothenate kinase